MPNEEENFIVEMKDEEGNSYLYEEEMRIPIDDKTFALLVAISNEEEHHCCHHHEGDEEHHCHHHHEGDEEHHCCHHHDEDEDYECGCGCNEGDVIIAKIVVGEDGEEEYIEPTDEEFEIVSKVYNDFFNDETEDD